MPSSEVPEEIEEDEGGGLGAVLQVFKIFKLARVLKLAKHSPGLQVKTYYSQKNLFKNRSAGHCLYPEE